jgi:hypothetical protein
LANPEVSCPAADNRLCARAAEQTLLGHGWRFVMALAARRIEVEESMEPRIARLEATTEHIRSDVHTLRQEMKELNTKLDVKFEQIQKSFESTRLGRVLDRLWMLLSIGAMLGVMARGFKRI